MWESPRLTLSLPTSPSNNNSPHRPKNQVLNALLFLYHQVLHIKLEGPIAPIRAKKRKRLPTVLTREETLRVTSYLSGTHRLIVRILYGSGLGLMECLRLRIKDLDFSRCQVCVRDGKGSKDRITHTTSRCCCSPAAATPPTSSATPVQRGCSQGFWFRQSALCPGSEVSQCQQGVVVAIRLSLSAPFA